MAHGRVIVFEGVDGAGKTTALALVAERLRARGVPVFLPRFGKDHASMAVRSIREITRDRRHVELDARSELMLYCAREAQVLAELVRPALARGATVLVDRSLLTAEVLGRARGLPSAECEAAAALAAARWSPDLTIVFDVHPRTSRIRKRLERIRGKSEQRGGRKGLAGSAFKERVRELYLAIARERGYPVLRAERATPAQLCERALLLVDHGAGAETGESALDARPLWLLPDPLPLREALDALPLAMGLLFGEGLIAGRELRQRAHASEPALCAYGFDYDDPLRETLAHDEPEHALRGLVGKPLQDEGDLRLRLLPRATAACIAALKHDAGEQADRLRERCAGEYPDAVLTSLAFREDARAAALRARCFAAGHDRARAISLQGCTSPEARALRAELFERDPVFGLQSLRGVHDDAADAWLERHAPAAPATVLEALSGRSDDAAYRLREALFGTGREVIDSIRGLEDVQAWALRERALSRWPSTVAHSLLRVRDETRASGMIARARELGAGDLHLMRRLQQLDEQPAWPAWVSSRRRAAQLEVDG